MRLRPLVIALIVWTASLSASIADETPSGSFVPGSWQRASSETGATRTAYFGLMGEVARPGVYAAPAVWTLADLIKRAGGITPQANKTVRIFRGGLLVEQLFLGSGEPPALLPNDLVVIGARDTSAPRATPGETGERPTEHAAIPAVQIGFVNLIDRPVIVKMRGDQAALAHIVGLLEQPADWAAKIRIFAPLGAASRDSDASDRESRPLESGSVLVFPVSSTRRDSLPALPGPIVETSSESSAAAAPKPLPSKRPVSKLGEAKRRDMLPVDSTGARPARPIVTAELTVDMKAANYPTGDRNSATSDIAPHLVPEPSQRPLASAGTRPAATNASALAHVTPEVHAQSHSGRVVAIMAAMSAMAGLAMLLTFASILTRWLESGKLPFRQLAEPASTRSTSAAAGAGVPAPPAPASLVGRPIRIDAGQPITRLSVDLAAIERAPHSTRAG